MSDATHDCTDIAEIRDDGDQCAVSDSESEPRSGKFGHTQGVVKEETNSHSGVQNSYCSGLCARLREPWVWRCRHGNHLLVHVIVELGKLANSLGVSCIRSCSELTGLDWYSNIEVYDDLFRGNEPPVKWSCWFDLQVPFLAAQNRW